MSSRSDRLARAALAPLAAELARRFGEGSPASVSLRGLDPECRAAVADLLGADRLPADRLSVGRLCTALGFADAAELRAAVEGVTGPIPDRRSARISAAADRAGLWDWLSFAAREVSSNDALDGWVLRTRAAGVRGGVEAHRRRLEGVLEVLRRLPADGTTLAALAQDAVGDPHGLDRGRSVASLVMDALCGAAPTDAESVRAEWERVGVAPDALSSTVLVLGARQPPGHTLHRYLAFAAEASEPVVLTLAQLRRWPLSPVAGAFVVENPSVIAEAAKRGWRDGPTLVCSSGRPSVAVLVLVRQLRAGSACVYQHADFDAAGLGITAWLAERAGTRPWLMDEASYRAAALHAGVSVPLAGPMPATRWDPPLAAAMSALGVAVYEEQLRTTLIDEMTA